MYFLCKAQNCYARVRTALVMTPVLLLASAGVAISIVVENNPLGKVGAWSWIVGRVRRRHARPRRSHSARLGSEPATNASSLVLEHCLAYAR